VIHPIVRARSGGECLRLIRSAPGDRALLVLLDLNTHGDDGRDALREIRSDDALKAVPVVVLSASANPRDLQFCYAQGANAYHVKPVDHALHLKMLQAVFAYWLGCVVLSA
jgi:CheY-like chemotaxis protein